MKCEYVLANNESICPECGVPTFIRECAELKADPVMQYLHDCMASVARVFQVQMGIAAIAAVAIAMLVVSAVRRTGLPEAEMALALIVAAFACVTVVILDIYSICLAVKFLAASRGTMRKIAVLVSGSTLLRLVSYVLLIKHAIASAPANSIAAAVIGLIVLVSAAIVWRGAYLSVYMCGGTVSRLYGLVKYGNGLACAGILLGASIMYINKYAVPNIITIPVLVMYIGVANGVMLKVVLQAKNRAIGVVQSWQEDGRKQ